MQIIKKINTSAALALDSNGKEIVVLGKGVGFPQVPYELTDLSIIERTFYDINPKYFGVIADLPQSILLASAEIAELAEIELNCPLSPQLSVTLADHLNFAMERMKNGIDLTAPIAYDIRHLYPKETELGLRALEILKEYADISLPEHEAINIAMHLINAEAESGDINAIKITVNVIGEIEAIVEQQLGITLDRESYNYSRFAMHLRYLVQRLASDQQVETRGASMLRSLSWEHPRIYQCAMQISNHLKQTWDWQCNDEEVLYLMLHIHRLYERIH